MAKLKPTLVIAALIVCLAMAVYAKKNRKDKYSVHRLYDHCGTICLQLYFRCRSGQCKNLSEDRCTSKCYKKFKRCPRKLCKQGKNKLSNKLKSRSTSRKRGKKSKKKSNKKSLNNAHGAGGGATE